jgi:hypothetical protein
MQPPSRLMDPSVKDDQIVVLSVATPQEGRVRTLQSKSLRDMKRWIGVPPDAVASHEAPRAKAQAYAASPASAPRAVHPPALRFENRGLESRFLTALANPIMERWAADDELVAIISRVSLSLVMFDDIYVEENQRLFAMPRPRSYSRATSPSIAAFPSS